MKTFGERWMHFWFEPAGPANLGLCRVLFFGAFFLFYLPQDFSLWGEVSHVFWSPIWLFQKLHLPVFSSDVLAILQIIWKVALALSCVGLLTRLSTACSFVLGLYLLGLAHNFGKTHHFDALVVITMGVMALSRSMDRWSIDGLIRRARRGSGLMDGRPPTSGEYTWPVRAVWLMFALIFFGAGISKIRYSGLEWIASDNLAILLIQHNYRLANGVPLTSWGLNLAQYGRLCQLLAAATVTFEIAYPLALLSHRARLLIVPVLFLIQAGILVLMGPPFYQFMICNLFWIPWDRISLMLTKRAQIITA